MAGLSAADLFFSSEPILFGRAMGAPFAAGLGYLVDRTGSWVVPFIASIVLLLLGAVLALRLRPDQALSKNRFPAYRADSAWRPSSPNALRSRIVVSASACLAVSNAAPKLKNPCGIPA